MLAASVISGAYRYQLINWHIIVYLPSHSNHLNKHFQIYTARFSLFTLFLIAHRKDSYTINIYHSKNLGVLGVVECLGSMAWPSEGTWIYLEEILQNLFLMGKLVIFMESNKMGK